MAFGLCEPSPGGAVRPQVGAGRPMVSRPRWGREARGGDSPGRREVPGVPEGGDPRGYRGVHTKLRGAQHYEDEGKGTTREAGWLGTSVSLLGPSWPAV